MFNNHGFIKVAAAIPEVRVADCDFNIQNMAAMVKKAEMADAELICFPELSITSASCGDLFLNNELLSRAEESLKKLLELVFPYEITGILGMPVKVESRLYNCAVVFYHGLIQAVIPQTNVSEKNARWFSSGAGLEKRNIELAGQETIFAEKVIFRGENYSFAIEVGNDSAAPQPPAVAAAAAGADILFQIAANPEFAGQHQPLRNKVLTQTEHLQIATVYSSAGYGESSTDTVSTGNILIAETGEMIAESKRFDLEPQLIMTEIDIEKTQAGKLRNKAFHRADSSGFTEMKVEYVRMQDFELSRKIAPHPFLPADAEKDSYFKEVLAIQATGLARRWQHTGLKNLVIGVSGGLDSTLALLVCAEAADKLGYDRKQILGVTMPGFGTTGRTYNNAIELMKSLRISTREISIKEASLLHFRDIGHDPEQHDVTYENVQARERTQILMDLANKDNGLVVGTGNMSEVALGWSTYSGDHISMYAVNIGVPKTLVRALTSWIAQNREEKTSQILHDILDTPISPELLPFDDKGEIKQKTEDVIGPYELHDFFLYYLVKYGFGVNKIYYLAQHAFEGIYSPEEIKTRLSTFLRRFVQQQFKRSCSPDGPQVTEISLSPRGGWVMPSDAHNFFKDLI